MKAKRTSHSAFRRFFALLLTLTMVTAMFSPSAFAASKSGKCGKNVTWKYTSSSKTLTISGKGGMYNYTNQDTPWDRADLDDRITTISVSKGVTKIGTEAFDGLDHVTKVSLPATLTQINPGAFEECERLTAITIPKSVKAIGKLAFSECDRLRTITFQGSAPSIAGNSFLGVTANVKYPTNNSSWKSSVRKNYGGKLTWNGASSSSSSTTLKGSCSRNGAVTWKYDSKTKTLTISGKGEMYNYPDIDTPWDKANIDEKITSIVVSNGVTKIGTEAFDGCERVTKVSLPSTLKTINHGAFEECERLTAITIPSSVKTIGAQAFAECVRLKTITFQGHAPSIGSNAFEDVTATVNYPVSDSTWTAAKRKNYGGRLTWKNVSSSTTPSTPSAPAPATPTLGAISNTDNGVQLTWNAVSNASRGYRVYRKSGASSWSKLADVTGTSYVDSSAVDGTTYTYTVRALGSGSTSGYDATGLTILRLDTPDVEDPINAAGSVTVRWEPEAGAASYRVYRRTSLSADWTQVAEVTGALSWSDANVTNGSMYYYTVQALSGTYSSAYDREGEETFYLSAPAIDQIAGSGTTRTVHWSENASATSYEIQYSTDSSFATKTTLFANQGMDFHTISGLTSGSTYSVRVRSCAYVAGEDYCSAWSTPSTLTA